MPGTPVSCQRRLRPHMADTNSPHTRRQNLIPLAFHSSELVVLGVCNFFELDIVGKEDTHD
jgi:hypothetical protein